jgi:hypothetical protein
MTSYLLSAWISHFISSISRIGAISPDHRHLLILDGHSSHATLEVIEEARGAGLDILTLPSHTSHALQPLDVAVFKPFKQYFREYRDFWTSRNMNQPAGKETLAQWVSLALRKALSEKNIKNGFTATGILPFNRSALDGQFAPSRVFAGETDAEEGIVHETPLDGQAVSDDAPGRQSGIQITEDRGCGSEAEVGMHEDEVPNRPGNEGEGEDSGNQNLEPTHIATDLAQKPNSQVEHYFVDRDCADQGVAEDIAGLDPGIIEPESITRFLTLPTVTPRTKSKFRDPILDFTKSHILT